MALEHQLRATNTFPRSDTFSPEELREQAAGSWTHALFTDTNVRSQVDWVLCSQSRDDACSSVIHDLGCGSDHKISGSSFLGASPTMLGPLADDRRSGAEA